jgi:hypothetical protein
MYSPQSFLHIAFGIMENTFKIQYYFNGTMNLKSPLLKELAVTVIVIFLGTCTFRVVLNLFNQLMLISFTFAFFVLTPVVLYSSADALLSKYPIPFVKNLKFSMKYMFTEKKFCVFHINM